MRCCGYAAVRCAGAASKAGLEAGSRAETAFFLSFFSPFFLPFLPYLIMVASLLLARPEQLRRVSAVPSGQPSPGSLQSGQQPSKAWRQMPHVSSLASHRHTATRRQSFTVTFIAGGTEGEMGGRGGGPQQAGEASRTERGARRGRLSGPGILFVLKRDQQAREGAREKSSARVGRKKQGDLQELITREGRREEGERRRPRRVGIKAPFLHPTHHHRNGDTVRAVCGHIEHKCSLSREDTFASRGERRKVKERAGQEKKGKERERKFLCLGTATRPATVERAYAYASDGKVL